MGPNPQSLTLRYLHDLADCHPLDALAALHNLEAHMTIVMAPMVAEARAAWTINGERRTG